MWWTGLCIGLCASEGMTLVGAAEDLPSYVGSIETTPSGASVRLDAPTAAPLGQTPLKDIKLRWGSHVLYISLAGYEERRMYIEVNRDGQVFLAELAELAILEVSPNGSDASDVHVFVDGERVGTLPFRSHVSPGRHMVQIKSGERLLMSEWINVGPGQVESLTFKGAPEAPKTGSLLVSTDIPGAEISVDGKVMGQTPLVIEAVPEGQHIVEIRARGKEPYRKEVLISSNERVSVNPALDAPGEPKDGVLIVNASVGGAIVFVDKRRRGAAPIVLHNLRAGSHEIMVQSPGHDTWQTSCHASARAPCEVYAELKPTGAAVRVEANVAYARLFVDGRELGTVPFDGYINQGLHKLEVRAEGYESFSKTARFEPSSDPQLILAILRPLGSTQDDRRRSQNTRRAQRKRYGAAPHSAIPLPVDQAYVDLSTGWPYLAQLGIGVGVLGFLDLAVVIRTFGRLSELEGGVKLGKMLTETWAIALQLKGGGGAGPSETVPDPATGKSGSHQVNTWFVSAEAITSLNLGDMGAGSVWLAIDRYSDRYDFSRSDRHMLLTPDPGRQNQVRFRTGGALEWAFDLHWNMWGLLEGVVWSSDANRRVLGDLYGLGVADTELYFRLGTTYKF